MIEELKQKLGLEVEHLQHELNVTLPNEIRKAVELGDLRENSEYKAALERQQFVQARLGQLRQRLSKLSQIDMTQIPTDRGAWLARRREGREDRASENITWCSVTRRNSTRATSDGIPDREGAGREGSWRRDHAAAAFRHRQLEIVELVTIHEAEPNGKNESGEWGVGSEEFGLNRSQSVHSPLPTPHSPLVTRSRSRKSWRSPPDTPPAAPYSRFRSSPAAVPRRGRPQEQRRCRDRASRTRREDGG